MRPSSPTTSSEPSLREALPARRRRGVSLMEVLVFATIALFIVMAIYRFLHKSVALTETASQAIGLQVGARNLLENMVRDINAAHMFLEVQPEKVVLAKYRFHGALNRLQLNTDPGYPFFLPGGVTLQKLPVTMVKFEYVKAERVVYRKTQMAVLKQMSRPPSGDLVEVTWEPSGTETTRVLARNVDEFKVRYFGYDAAGKLVSYEQGVPGGALGTVNPWRNVALAVVHFRAKYDFASDKYRDQVVDILTKIWSHKLMRDARYRPAFSSLDYDTRY